MNKKDKVKLDVVSEIDDEIVEKVTIKRFLLSRRHSKRMVKWVSVSAAAVLLLFAGILIPILLNQKHVPVYRGMTVSSSLSSAEVPFTGNIPRFDLLAADGTTGSQSGTPGASNRFDHVFDAPYPTRVANQDDPFGHGDKGQKFIEAVSGAMQYTPSESKMYYAMPGEDVYINIHFDNPDNYEILSFTLNGKKYSSYMFEEGSDMENLILKVNVCDVPGIVEYTIDAIKYVDGERIKDVIIGGDRTVRVGVYTEEQPTATVADEYIGYDSLSLRISATDPYDLISITGGRSAFVLYDGEEIVAIEELSPQGESDITLEELKPDTLYQYAVVAVYDNLNGVGTDVHVLYQKAFYTQPILSYDGLTVTQTGITFSFLWGEHYEGGVVESLDLYLGGVKVRSLDPDTREIGDLLSGTSYTLVATYSYKGNTETAALNFRTEAKSKPRFRIDKTISAFSISFDVIMTNNETNASLICVELYQSGSLVASSDSFEGITVDNLTPNTRYTIVVRYADDLNDGNGIVEKEYTETVKTLSEYTVQGVTYQCNDIGNCTITLADNTMTNLVITCPDGYRISTIPDDFMQGGINLQSVELYGTICYIGTSAFQGSKKLESVRLPDSLLGIGNDAFHGCLSLTEISLPDSLQKIGDSAFSGCASLTKITLPDSLQQFGGGVFYGCRNLTEIHIPDSVKTIPNGIFTGCVSLTKISLPDSLQRIGEGAFEECTSLTEITLPDSLLEIGKDAFYGCKRLRKITLPDSFQQLGVGVFMECLGLTEVYIPDSVKLIGEKAFLYTPLTNIHYNGTIDEWKAIVKGYEMVGITVTVHCTDGTYEQQP